MHPSPSSFHSLNFFYFIFSSSLSISFLPWAIFSPVLTSSLLSSSSLSVWCFQHQKQQRWLWKITSYLHPLLLPSIPILPHLQPFLFAAGHLFQVSLESVVQQRFSLGSHTILLPLTSSITSWPLSMSQQEKTMSTSHTIHYSQALQMDTHKFLTQWPELMLDSTASDCAPPATSFWKLHSDSALLPLSKYTLTEATNLNWKPANSKVRTGVAQLHRRKTNTSSVHEQRLILKVSFNFESSFQIWMS